MTVGDYYFVVEPQKTRFGEYTYVVYDGSGVVVKRSPRSYPSYFDTFMRAWLAVNNLRKG